jgi:hypothetical protein
VQYSTVQYSTVQCSTVQCSTVQCSTVQCSTVQCSPVQYSTHPDVGYPDRIGTSSKFCREFNKIKLPGHYRLKDQVQDSVVGSKTSNLAWSKCLDAGIYCK